ncbi:MAG: hypothetical protein JO329_12945 [Planctomycetaceae bacterium]|jgi:hypothetical protein|nr:hypothetical protein [Planctomycetaceae bacterium]
MTTDGNPPKSRKRPASKTASQHDDKRVKVTLYLPAELARRFAVHAVQTDMDKSELFAEMVRAHCSRYVVHDRGRGPGESAAPDGA